MGPNQEGTSVGNPRSEEHIQVIRQFLLPGHLLRFGQGIDWGLVGRNGAGKGTVIRGIVSLSKLDSGTVLIDGVPAVPFGDQVKHIGYVPDRPIFYEWMSVDDAIRFTSKFYATWRPELAERLKADFSLRGEKRIKNLSAEMRTKLSLLLPIAHEPRLLILNEPTSGLGPICCVDPLEYLVDLRKSAQNLSIRSRTGTLCPPGQCAISCCTSAPPAKPQPKPACTSGFSG